MNFILLFAIFSFSKGVRIDLFHSSLPNNSSCVSTINLLSRKVKLLFESLNRCSQFNICDAQQRIISLTKSTDTEIGK